MLFNMYSTDALQSFDVRPLRSNGFFLRSHFARLGLPSYNGWMTNPPYLHNLNVSVYTNTGVLCYPMYFLGSLDMESFNKRM